LSLDDPQDAEVARMYKTDKKLYEHTARMWTENFAKEVTVEDKIKKLMEMGFPDDMCRESLERYDGDENLALNFLLGG
jgi:ubiquitin-conjugating enzyme (huntingtin interacting protein 2)